MATSFLVYACHIAQVFIPGRICITDASARHIVPVVGMLPGQWGNETVFSRTGPRRAKSCGFDSSGYAGRLNHRRVELREQVPGVPDAPSSKPSPARGEGFLSPAACCTTRASSCNPLRLRHEKALSLRTGEGHFSSPTLDARRQTLDSSLHPYGGRVARRQPRVSRPHLAVVSTRPPRAGGSTSVEGSRQPVFVTVN
jgi:hypothetical protein